MQGWWNENMVIQRVSAVVINHDSAYSLYNHIFIPPPLHVQINLYIFKLYIIFYYFCV